MDRNNIQSLFDRIAKLELAIEYARPIFDKHGPVTGSREWQEAWAKADAALKLVPPPLLTIEKLRSLMRQPTEARD